jgi:uncharacterized membrane protein YdfJ with MMPL/SSD domain
MIGASAWAAAVAAVLGLLAAATVASLVRTRSREIGSRPHSAEAAEAAR